MEMTGDLRYRPMYGSGSVRRTWGERGLVKWARRCWALQAGRRVFLYSWCKEKLPYRFLKI